MKTILFVCGLIVSTSLLANPIIRIGERSNGQKVSIAYVLINHNLTTSTGFRVKSFTLSVKNGASLYEKSISGNDFAVMLPYIKKLAIGDKLYFDHVVIISEKGEINSPQSAIFTIEDFTNPSGGVLNWGTTPSGAQVNVKTITASDSLWHNKDANFYVESFVMSFGISGCIDRQKLPWQQSAVRYTSLIGTHRKGQKNIF